MGGRGAEAGGRYGGGGDMKPGDILEEKDLLSERRKHKEEVDEVMSAVKEVYDEYGLILDDI